MQKDALQGIFLVTVMRRFSLLFELADKPDDTDNPFHTS